MVNTNRFTLRNGEPDYIHIDPVNYPLSCLSSIGRKGGKQLVRAGNCKINGTLSWGRISHELMHVAGNS